jgi:periplasmic divalent cation tolerance protein
LTGERRVVLMVTAATRDEAERLGEGLVAAGLGVRGSVVPAIHSFWQEHGEIERAHEALLIVSVPVARLDDARAYVREHHSFEEPHLLAMQLFTEG